MVRPLLIAVTGAPCSGKTETMELLKIAKGFPPVYLVPEAPTYLCTGKRPLHQKPDFTDPYQLSCFDKLVYESRKLSAMQGRDLSEYEFVLFDRGTLDGSVYSGDFFRMNDTTIERELSRYDGVILMNTFAGTEFYNHDNQCRSETAEEALEIERKLREVYRGHPNFFEVWADMNNLKRASVLMKKIQEWREIC